MRVSAGSARRTAIRTPPICTSSPPLSSAWSTLAPSTNVPSAEPTSRSRTPSRSGVSEAWRQDVPASQMSTPELWSRASVSGPATSMTRPASSPESTSSHMAPSSSVLLVLAEPGVDDERLAVADHGGGSSAVIRRAWRSGRARGALGRERGAHAPGGGRPESAVPCSTSADPSAGASTSRSRSTSQPPTSSTAPAPPNLRRGAARASPVPDVFGLTGQPPDRVGPLGRLPVAVLQRHHPYLTDVGSRLWSRTVDATRYAHSRRRDTVLHLAQSDSGAHTSRWLARPR